MPITINVAVTLSDEQVAAISLQVAKEVAARQSGNPLTTAQFARAIGRSRGYVRSRVEAGIILKLNMPGETMISAAELERYRNGGKSPKQPR